MSRIISIVLVIVVLFFLSGAMFVIDETEQAVVTQFGEPVRIITGDYTDAVYENFKKEVEAYNNEHKMDVEFERGAGLYFKLPLIQNVVKFEDRILMYDVKPTDVVTKDKKKLWLDNYARWRIVNPLSYLRAVGTEARAQERIDDIVYSTVRSEIGRFPLVEVVRTTDNPRLPEKIELGRAHLMEEVTEEAKGKALPLGIEIVDVRIKRADLPEQNQLAVFNRMKAERERISKQYRSEGEEEAAKIRAETERDYKVILAEAYKEAEKLKGEGDARATKIYADAYGQYQQFYEFTKALETMERSKAPGDQLVIGLDAGLYRFLKEGLD